MSRGLKALEVLLETIDGYEHDWNEIDIAKETIKLELRWLDGYSEQLAKREEQLDKIREFVLLDVDLDRLYMGEIHFKGISYGDILRILKKDFINSQQYLKLNEVD